MTPSDDIIRITQFEGVYFDLTNEHKILLSIIKKNCSVFMMPIKTYNKIEMIVLYFVMKKNLEISCQNGSEHETTSFT